MNFKKGDIVQLKSGGPPMTVVVLPEEDLLTGNYHCSWFDKTKLLHGEFSEEALKLTTESQG